MTQNPTRINVPADAQNHNEQVSTKIQQTRQEKLMYMSISVAARKHVWQPQAAPITNHSIVATVAHLSYC